MRTCMSHAHTPRAHANTRHTRARSHTHTRAHAHPGSAADPDADGHAYFRTLTNTWASRFRLTRLTHARASWASMRPQAEAHMCAPTDTPASPCAQRQMGPRTQGHAHQGLAPWPLAGVFAFTWIEQPALFWDLGVGRGASSTLKCLWQNSPRQERRQAVLRRKSPEQLQPSPALGPRGNIPPRWTATELPALEMQEGAAGLQVPSTPSTRQPRKQGPGSCDGVSRAAPTP